MRERERERKERVYEKEVPPPLRKIGGNMNRWIEREREKR